MALPGDPVMLLSVVNLKLRDYYPTLDSLCEDLDVDQADLCAQLAAAGYQYAPHQNHFKERRNEALHDDVMHLL